MSITNFFPSKSPESQGISSQSILDFLEAIEKEKGELHSFILLRHGKTLAQGWWSPYREDLPHALFSLSKSFTSTAIGFVMDEGLLTEDDQVISFFPDDIPSEIEENLKKMKIRHLLSMTTGHEKDTSDREHGLPQH